MSQSSLEAPDPEGEGAVTPKAGDNAKADQPSKASIPALPAEVLEKLPEEQRSIIESFFAAGMSIGPLAHPLAQKVTPEHIGQMIQARAKESELGFADRRDARRWAVGAFVFTGVTVVVLIAILAILGQNEALNDIIKIGVGALGGLGAGYGFAEWRRR